MGCLGVVALLWYLRIRVQFLLLCGQLVYSFLPCFLIELPLPFILHCSTEGILLVVSSTEGHLSYRNTVGEVTRAILSLLLWNALRIVDPASLAPHHLPIKRIVLLPVWLPDPS